MEPMKSTGNTQSKWHDQRWIQVAVTMVWCFGLVFNLAWSTWPIPFRIVSGLACAAFAAASAAAACRCWQREWFRRKP